MTDNTHENRRPFEPGRRYAPRSASAQRHVEVRNSVVTPAKPATEPVHTDVGSNNSRRQRTVSSAKPARPRQSRSAVLKRKGLGSPKVVVEPMAPAAPVASQKQRHPRFHPANLHPALVFMSAAVLAAVLVFAGGILFFRAKNESSDKYTLGSAPATLGATTSKSNAVDINEVAPSDVEVAAYRTAPSDPRYLKIPKMQVNARILSMDAGRDGLPAVPQNIFDVGWFTGSARPGDSGVMLVSGQVVGNAKAGIFDVLDSLVIGDMVQVELGDGKILTYKVTKIDQYDPSQITPEVALKPAESRKPGLNLLAANGRYNVKTNTFEKRSIVRTVQQ